MITSIHTWTDAEIDMLLRRQIALIIRRAEAGHTQAAHEAALHLGEWAARHVPAPAVPAAKAGAA